MQAAEILNKILEWGIPLTNALVALPAAFLAPAILSGKTPFPRRLAAIGAVAALFAGYHLAGLNERAADWLIPLNTPLFAVLLVIALPAVYLPRGRVYKIFLVVPAVFLAVAVAAVFKEYADIPKEKAGFYWFLIRPVWLMAGVVSIFVLVRTLLSLGNFRRFVRATCLIVLVWGGFAFRANYTEYQEMLGRRQDALAQMKIMNLSETSPVLQHEDRMLYVPSAPCRFTADGGYVQGCVLEHLQRTMQVDFTDVSKLDTAEVYTISTLIGALVILVVLYVLTGRAFCGWVCPLSTIGGALDWARRKLRIGHFKPGKAIKTIFLSAGLGLAGFTLLLAKAVPHLDESGQFLGCKIPLFPFCKICPSQQVCPVAAAGPDNYPGLPTWDWLYGFFTVACAVLLGVFLIGFMTSRRLWCRFCPMGIIAGFFNRGGMLRLGKDGRKCNLCGACSEACPMEIDRIRSETAAPDLSGYDCVLCLKCVEKCPQDGCLYAEHGGVRIASSKLEDKRL